MYVESIPFTSRAGAIAHYAAVRRRINARSIPVKKFQTIYQYPIGPVYVAPPKPLPSLADFILTCRDGIHVGPELANILLAVSEVTGVGTLDIKSPRRFYKTTQARQLFFYVARHATGKSLPAIGRLCGDKDHTTVLHGIRKISEHRDQYETWLKAILTKLAISHDALKDWGRG